MIRIRVARDEVVAIIAAFRGSEEWETDDLDSLERAWLIDRLEQRLGVELDLADERLAEMDTVDAAVAALNGACAA
jgi:acyl carrier protein